MGLRGSEVFFTANTARGSEALQVQHITREGLGCQVLGIAKVAAEAEL